MAKYQTGYNLFHQFGEGTTWWTLQLQHTGTVKNEKVAPEYLDSDLLLDYYHIKFTLALLILTYIFILKLYSKIFNKKL